MSGNYILIKCSSSNELIVADINCVKSITDILKKCDTPEKLELFESVDVDFKGQQLKGKPLHVAATLIECEEERLKFLRQSQVLQDARGKSLSETNNMDNISITENYYGSPSSEYPQCDAETPNAFSEYQFSQLRNRSNVEQSLPSPPVILDLDQAKASEYKSSTGRQTSNTQVHEEYPQDLKAMSMLVQPEVLWPENKANLIKIWSYILKEKDEREKTAAKLKENDAQQCSDTLTIGGKYKVSKSIVARGLSEKNTLDSYIKYLIRETWPKEEYVNRNLTGKNGKNTLDKEKLSAFIHYAISSWNQHYKTQLGVNDRLIETKDIPYRVSKLRASVSQMCSDLKGSKKGKTTDTLCSDTQTSTQSSAE